MILIIILPVGLLLLGIGLHMMRSSRPLIISPNSFGYALLLGITTFIAIIIYRKFQLPPPSPHSWHSSFGDGSSTFASSCAGGIGAYGAAASRKKKKTTYYVYGVAGHVMIQAIHDILANTPFQHHRLIIIPSENIVIKPTLRESGFVTLRITSDKKSTWPKNFINDLKHYYASHPTTLTRGFIHPMLVAGILITIPALFTIFE